MTMPSSDSSPPRALPVYPFATSPDIVRSNQKDADEVLTLSTSLTDLLRRLYGSRFTHKYSSGIETLSHLLYFSLTTLIGNRTLGEEYTDLHQIDSRSGQQDLQRLPAIRKRAGYILLSLIFPYALGKALPSLRKRIQSVLKQGLSDEVQVPTKESSFMLRFQTYCLTHLADIMSPGPIHALTLTLFYFSGSYYHLSKRLLGLRYVFSKRLSSREEDARVGYEVLGLLLVLQIITQACMHLRDALRAPSTNSVSQTGSKNAEDMTLNGSSGNLNRIASLTHTTIPTQTRENGEFARYDLENPATMAWIQTQPQRNCTLCLEPMKDPSVATCGHIFCWTCILDWVKEKAECPLCRQGILRQHILPLRG